MQIMLIPLRLLAMLPWRLNVLLAGCIICFFVGRAWEGRRYRFSPSPQKLAALQVNPELGATAPGGPTCHH